MFSLSVHNLVLLLLVILKLVYIVNCENCEPLIPPKGLTVVCVSGDGVLTNCSNPSTPTTSAEYKCDKFYRPIFRFDVTRKLECNSNGQWLNFRRFKEYRCEIDCGKPTRTKPLISYGNETVRFAWPWHATIFIENPKGSLQFIYLCGGSLISERVVITASHCLDVGEPLASFRIILGSISSNWTHNSNDEFVQIFTVRRKFVPEEYEQRHLRSDIALVELDHPARISEAVLPVCFPFDNDDAKPHEPLVVGHGEVVGYGKDEHLDYQLYLRYTRLPIVGAAKCSEVLGVAPGREQFCAGVVNGSSVCRGDSGGGMAFTRPGTSKYYIQGVVSSGSWTRRKVTCDGVAYFTNVLYFTKWVSQILSQIIDDYENPEQIQWPNFQIPYQIVNTFPSGVLESFRIAIEDFHKKTCLQWIPRIEEMNYVSFEINESGQGCAHTEQAGCYNLPRITLERCRGKKAFLKEMVHALCIVDEHKRADRDDYLDNPCGEEKVSSSEANHLYDYRSVTHKSCSTVNCFTPKLPVQDCGGSLLSVLDAEKINDKFNCPGCKSYRFKFANLITDEYRSVVRGGNDYQGDELYPCRGYMDGHIIVGKANRLSCWLSNNGKEQWMDSGYEVLTNPSGANLVWERSTGVIPNNAIPGGRTKENIPIYIGRCDLDYQGGRSVHIGKVVGDSPGVVLVGYAHIEHTCTAFDILVCR